MVQSQIKITDNNGKAKINVASRIPDSLNIITKYGGSDKYRAISKNNTLTILNRTNTIFIDSNLANEGRLRGARSGWTTPMPCIWETFND